MHALRELEERVLAYIDDPVSATFDEVAARVVDYQRRWNPRLKDFWDQRGFVETIDADEIPAVPTDVFRYVRLISTEGEARTMFRTSGTTSGSRGESPRLSTRVYDAGALRHAKATLLEDPPYQLVNLVLDPASHPDSSLSHMVALLAERFGTRRSSYFLTESGVDVEALADALRSASGPVLIFGTAFALVAALDSGLPAVTLPEASLVVETGGFKGKSRTVARDDLYRQLAFRLSVPVQSIRSEYSMTELSSQLYSRPWNLEGEQRLVPPHWCRVRAVEPETLAPLPRGVEGILRFVDLANVDTVVAVQTSDLGVVHDDDTVTLRGRALGAQPRGCSLAVEEILALTQRSFT